MLNKFGKLTSKKAVKYVLIAGISSIVLNWSGITRTLDLALYDFGFHLRLREPIDKRIILVEWNEENLQVLEETIISDDTLAALIEKIRIQQPRLIAFDIFRDIPVFSPRLSDEENSEAYDRLQNLFRSTPNLFGIEKVVPPKTNPPKELKKRNHVGATDLPSDRDNAIRRAYTFPQLTKEGKPAGIPHLSVGLAQKYLAIEGWQGEMLDNNSLKIYNQHNTIIINPLKTFAGAYFDDRDGLDFLVNWRKGEKLFRRVSTAEVISDRVPPDIFSDRLVIIGNVSSSTGDRHTVPLNRWRKTNKIEPLSVETFGVDIVAQITSSIISAALDERPLMNPAPKIIKVLLFLISVGATIKFIVRYRYFQRNLYLLTLPWILLITSILILCSFIAHSFGWWLPVAWTIVVIWILYIGIARYWERIKEIDRASGLETFALDLHHSIGNRLDSIKSSKELIQYYFDEIENSLSVDSSLQEAKEIIYEATSNIEEEILRTEKYKIQLDHFIKYSYLGVEEIEKPSDVNRAIKEIVRRFRSENKIFTEVDILEQYDARIMSKTKISKSALEIILNNLLNNAVFALAAKAKAEATKEYVPIVCIQTKLKSRKIQITVEDNGVGIPPAFHQKIFLPFKSFKNDKKATGLGLHLVKKIVNLHGGTIKVESNLGEGSKFIFTLPIVVNRNHSSLLDNFLSFLRKK